VVSVADLVDDVEWLDGIDVSADVRFYKGELPIEVLIGTVSLAKCTLGGIGFLQPMSLAVGTPCFCVYGGFGFENTPKGQLDDRMPLHLFGYAAPDPICNCGKMKHNCIKYIPDSVLKDAFESWLERTVK
jgi:hypothetical protein